MSHAPPRHPPAHRSLALQRPRRKPLQRRQRNWRPRRQHNWRPRRQRNWRLRRGRLQVLHFSGGKGRCPNNTPRPILAPLASAPTITLRSCAWWGSSGPASAPPPSLPQLPGPERSTRGRGKAGDVGCWRYLGFGGTRGCVGHVVKVDPQRMCGRVPFVWPRALLQAHAGPVERTDSGTMFLRDRRPAVILGVSATSVCKSCRCVFLCPSLCPPMHPPILIDRRSARVAVPLACGGAPADVSCVCPPRGGIPLSAPRSPHPPFAPSIAP